MQQANQSLREALTGIYEEREAKNITAMVMEKLTGWTPVDRSINKTSTLSDNQESLLKGFQAQLIQAKPVQYVLNECWFFGMSLYVDEHVLIPRPETEELADLAISYLKKKNRLLSVLDIGTGSGCIPLAIKKTLPHLQVHAMDVSEKAIEIAARNAASQKLEIQFHKVDFLDEDSWHQLPETDLITSNPPYIPRKDMLTMHENVLRYEPHLALFVDNEDPLIFYRKIVGFAHQKLKPGGAVFLEIHESYGSEVSDLFNTGFSLAEIKKDMQGKERIIFAEKQIT
ncbi:MAG: peptide chain release factor N(5)-glutamine methyltransferase [Gemmatimonadaceae bacterium]|nr:peptide chain release factor N(5)-glutamine methyltransferase [Chitinophagaceae bacterium]